MLLSRICQVGQKCTDAGHVYAGVYQIYFGFIFLPDNIVHIYRASSRLLNMNSQQGTVLHLHTKYRILPGSDFVLRLSRSSEISSI